MVFTFVGVILICIMELNNPHLPTVTALQSNIDTVLDSLNEWTASLHVSCIVGSSGKVDLFQFTASEYRVKKGGIQPVKFDPTVYPPTDEGLQLLFTYLSYQGLTEGTVLSNHSGKTCLNCFRCRVYVNSRLKKPLSGTSSSLDEDSDIVSVADDGFDVFGVKFGIGEHKFHRDNSFKQLGGLIYGRGSTTVLPLESKHVCGVKLNFCIHNYGKEDGFIHLVCGYGARDHTFHCKPNTGDLYLL
jgi:hypothetical protein